MHSKTNDYLICCRRTTKFIIEWPPFEYTVLITIIGKESSFPLDSWIFIFYNADFFPAGF